MSDIKLTYWDLKGRAEISRLILSYSGARFTDERLTEAQFNAIRSSLAYGQMHILNYKGQVIYQFNTIARYMIIVSTMLISENTISRFLAHEYGLVGKSNVESAQCDEIVDAVSDLQNAMIKVFGDGAGVEKVLNTAWPTGLVRSTNIL